MANPVSGGGEPRPSPRPGSHVLVGHAALGIDWIESVPMSDEFTGEACHGGTGQLQLAGQACKQ